MKIKEPRLIIGDKRGRWTVVDIIITRNPPRMIATTKLLCKCECGEERIIAQKDLKPNRTMGCNKCYNDSKFKDLTNVDFESLKAVSYIRDKNGRVFWNCLCRCGKSIIVSSYRLIKRRTVNCGKCNSYGELTAIHFHHLKGSASVRNIIFDVSPKDLWELFIAQNRKCALTGIELTLWTGIKDYGTASLDRINSNIGYTKDNCQWIHKSVNLCKHVLNNEEFISLCMDVVKYSKSEYVPWNHSSLYKYKETSKNRRNKQETLDKTLKISPQSD